MPSTEETTGNFLVLDHNIAAGYVMYIVDIWDGDLDDPATGVGRYIGVWRGENLETEDGEAFDPDFSNPEISGYYGKKRFKPQPLVWQELETVKEADRESERYRDEVEAMTYKEDGYYYGNRGREVKLFTAYLDAIDRLAENYDNDEAWAAIDAWRNYNATKHEK